MALRENFGPRWLAVTWSLAIEEQFYICLPIIIRFVPRRKLPFFLCSSFLLAIVLRIFISGYRPESFVPAFVLMPCRADSLMLGVLCAYLVREKSLVQLLKGHTLKLYALLMLLGALIAWMAFRDHQPGSPSMAIYGYSLLAVFYACLLLIAISERRGIVSFVVRNPVLRWFGLIAYGVYLLHEPINGFCHGLLPSANNQLVTVLAFSLTTSVASLSWIYFESKIIALGHRLKYQDAKSVFKNKEEHLNEAVPSH